MAHLQLENISLSFGAHRVVEGLSFGVEKGGIGCLLGPSGCGKTTVLRAIAGFERIGHGCIRLDGAAIADEQTHLAPERRRIGMVFQDYALFPHLDVARNIGFGLRGRPQQEISARVGELLRTIGLAGHEHKFPHELSGGQQQRIALARALAPRPALLLLDEPFSNLDVDLRERLSAEVRQIIKAAGITAILVTHDQHEAFAVADEIGVMHEGRIQQWDSPYNLYHRPANRFVADFVGQGVFIDGTVLNRRQVRMELGVLESGDALSCGPACETCDAGCDVDVLLRPDDVIHDDVSPLRAEVLTKAFRGADILYTLRLPSGTRVLSLVPSHHNHSIGERIGIRLDVDHVVAFHKPGPAGEASLSAIPIVAAK